MKFLHLADLHIGKRVYEYSMLEEQKHVLEQALQMVVRYGADAVLIAGDVYDKSIPAVEGIKLFDAFLTCLMRRKIPVLVISGNHDSAERLSFGRELFESASLYLSGTYEEEIKKVTLTDEHGPVHFYLLPFLKPQQVLPEEGEEAPKDYTEAVRMVLGRLQTDPSQRNVILAHQFVGGGESEPERTESETQSVGGLDMVDYRVFDSFDYVALGHLHGAQHVGRDTVRYAGSPIKYSFSEARQQKSATLVTMEEKGKVTIEKLPFHPIHELREIKGSFAQLTSPEVVNAADPQDYLHITLTDDEEIYDVFGKLRSVYPHVMALDFDNARTRAEGAEAVTTEALREKSVLELFTDFFEKQTGTEMTPVQQKIMQDILTQGQGE